LPSTATLICFDVVITVLFAASIGAADTDAAPNSAQAAAAIITTRLARAERTGIDFKTSLSAKLDRPFTLDTIINILQVRCAGMK